jgi:hypothetical protein
MGNCNANSNTNNNNNGNSPSSSNKSAASSSAKAKAVPTAADVKVATGKLTDGDKSDPTAQGQAQAYFSPCSASSPLHDVQLSCREVKRILTAEPHRVDERLHLAINVKGVICDDEYTPLHVAAIYGKLDLVQELISRGADLNAVSEVRTADVTSHHL